MNKKKTFHLESECRIVTPSCDCRKCDSTIFFTIQQFVWRA